MSVLPRSRVLSLTTKAPTHYLVKYIACNTYQVRSRSFFKSDDKIQHMVLYEVQYGNRKQIGTALVIGSGTENEMMLQKNERECQTSPEPTPRSPTPPPSPAESIEIPLPGSPSLPIIRRPAKGKRSTKIPKPKPTSKKSTKPLAKVLSRGMPPTTPQSSIPGPTTVSLSPTNSTSRPTTSGPTTNPTSRPTTSGPTTNSNSRPTTSGPTTNPTPRPTTSGPTTNPTSRPTTNSTSRPRPLSPPTSPQIIVHQQPHLQSPQPPSPATPSVNHRSIFPDDHRVFHVLDTILRGVTRLNMKVTDIDNRLKTLEAKHDIHHEESRRGRRQETPWSAPPADSDDGSEATHTIAHPAGMVIDQDRLLTLKGKSQSAGNFAALVIRELKPHLFGPENLRQLYNWNGGGVNGKRGLSPNTKTVVSNYTTMFYPECQKEDYFRDTVIQKINESLRRPAVKRCRRRLLETPLNTINNDANHI
ncbi:uncharacterized protein LOC143049888 isoform X1 [Mytilus galloprovincialis]|uniref:uncharacterized protein LOC143049888 isoform X1 n=2 Tax=Mytilus galloprovincialis TaxID=29158 RepID=UPI003F7C280A